MNEKDMQHGYEWGVEDLTGLFISEKMNGCRAYWDDSTLYSRGGIAVRVPQYWREQLPQTPLDCELYDGIDGVYRCGAAIRYGKFTDTMSLIVFDAPNVKGNWSERMAYAAEVTRGCSFVRCEQSQNCKNNEDAFKRLSCIQQHGGEGLMLRHPTLEYSAGRTDKLLKLTPYILERFYDCNSALLAK